MLSIEIRVHIPQNRFFGYVESSRIRAAETFQTTLTASCVSSCSEWGYGGSEGDRDGSYCIDIDGCGCCNRSGCEVVVVIGAVRGITTAAPSAFMCRAVGRRFVLAYYHFWVFHAVCWLTLGRSRSCRVRAGVRFGGGECFTRVSNTIVASRRPVNSLRLTPR